MFSLRKQPTFSDATTGFPAKWRLRNECRNSILMTRHYPDLGSASDWLNQISHAARPIRSTTQIWVVTRHQYGISALVSQTSFRGETSGGVAECRLFLRLGEGVLNFCTHKFHAFRGSLLFFQIIFEFLVRHFQIAVFFSKLFYFRFQSLKQLGKNMKMLSRGKKEKNRNAK